MKKIKKPVKSAKSAAKKAMKPAKAPAAAKPAKKPAKSAKADEGIYIAPADDEAPEAPAKATKAKPTKAAKVAKPAAKAEKKAEKKPKPAAVRPDYKPVKLPATFDDGDGFSITITAEAITFTRGLREAIFDPRRAHFFPRDVSKTPDGKPLPQTIKAGSVSLVRGQVGVVIPAESAEAVAAVLTAKDAADKAAKAARADKAKGVQHD